MRFSRTGDRSAQPVRWRNQARLALALCLRKALRSVSNAVVEVQEDPKDQCKDVAQGKGHTRGGPCRRCRRCKPEHQHKDQGDVNHGDEGPSNGGAPLPRRCRAQGCQQRAKCKNRTDAKLRWRPWVVDRGPTKVNRRGNYRADPEPEPL